ncbi:caspase family protein [Ensifer aridi]|uniref:caspase family protein n=1 Tax=Ensifer aridi TaxID=1708715 RepID=UPI00111C285D|nr:caspase family protein [Ensifer aridi]
MKAQRTLTICVGISAYPTHILQPGEAPLRFLAKSASDLSALFQRIWPNSESKHIVIVDEAASLARFEEALASGTEEYDLQVIYLGGHGRIGANNEFQFLFHDQRPEKAAVVADKLDLALAQSRAVNVVLLLDSCHSGAYGDRQTFFSTAASPASRICVASSRSHQKSWEDPYFKRSLFADAVARSLTSTPSQPGGEKRVAGDFFDEVARDVTRHAFALKRSEAQEPLLIGHRNGPLSLPTVAPEAQAIKSITTFQTLLRRSRQIIAGLALLLLVGACFTSYATWRPALNGAGHIEIRPGPKWLSPLNAGFWQRRVETDAQVLDLRDAVVHEEVLNEQGLHAWPGLNSAGVRRWADAFLEAYLNADTASRWRVRLGYPDAVKRLSTMSTRIVPTRTFATELATELAAESKLLQPATALDDIWTVQWRSNVVTGASCNGDPISQTQSDEHDFYLRLSQPENYVAWLRGLALAARADEAVGYEEVAKIAEMFTEANRIWRDEYTGIIASPDEPITAARIAARFTERPTLSEVSALADVAAAIAARRSDEGIELVTGDERSRLVGLMTGCAEVAAYILAALGKDGDPERVVSWAKARATSDQGRVALRILAASGALPDNAIVWVLDTLGFAGDASDRKRAFVNARAWLSAVADLRPLPDEVVFRLMDYAAERAARGDSEGSDQVTAIIARTPEGAAPTFDPRYRALVNVSADVLPSKDAEVELAGLLARSATTLSPAQRDALMSVLDTSDSDPPPVVFTNEDKGERPEAIELVAGLRFVHLLAFSRFVLGSGASDGPAKDPRSLPFLRRALADGLRFGIRPERLEEVADAAAVALEYQSNPELDATTLRDQLRHPAADAATRRAGVEIVHAAFARMSRARWNEILQGLRTQWRKEREPEVKLALAAAIVGAVAKTKLAKKEEARSHEKRRPSSL